MAKIYRCFDDAGNPMWTIEIYGANRDYPQHKFYLNKRHPDFDTLFMLLHSIFGVDECLMSE